MKIALIIKNMFMYITLIWSALMSAVYLVVVFELPIFAWISYLPLGEDFCQLLTFILLSGIWIVPVLYIITISLMIIMRIKTKKSSKNKIADLSVILIPICLAALMLLTNFMELLA